MYVVVLEMKLSPCCCLYYVPSSGADSNHRKHASTCIQADASRRKSKLFKGYTVYKLKERCWLTFYVLAENLIFRNISVAELIMKTEMAYHAMHSACMLETLDEDVFNLSINTRTHQLCRDPSSRGN